MALYDSTDVSSVMAHVGTQEEATALLDLIAPRIAAAAAYRALHHGSVAVAGMGAEHVEEVHLLMDVRALLDRLAQEYQQCL